MHLTLYNTNILHTTQYTLYTIKNTLYAINYKIYTIHYTLYTLHYTLYTILTFMGTLQVRTKWNYQSWIQIFQIKFLFLVLSFWKCIALVYFLKTDWGYTFLKVKNSNQNFNLKKSFELLEIWTFILHMFLDILEFTVENKKKCLGKTVLEMWSQKLTKNGFKVHKTTFRKKCEN